MSLVYFEARMLTIGSDGQRERCEELDGGKDHVGNWIIGYRALRSLYRKRQREKVYEEAST